MRSCVHRGPRARPTTPPISPVPPYRPTSAPPEASPSRALNQEPPRTPATASAGPPLTRCSREETLCFCSLEGSRRERAWLAGDQSRRGTGRPPTLQIPPQTRLHALHAHVRPSAGCVLHGGSKGYRRKGSRPPPLRRGHDCRCWGQPQAGPPRARPADPAVAACTRSTHAPPHAPASSFLGEEDPGLRAGGSAPPKRRDYPHAPALGTLSTPDADGAAERTHSLLQRGLRTRPPHGTVRALLAAWSPAVP